LPELQRLDIVHLSPQEQERLAILAQQGDGSAAEKLITSNLRGVMAIAKKFHMQPSEYSLAELYEYGVLGLTNAVYNFNPDVVSEKTSR